MIKQLAGNFNLNESDARNAVSQLLPALNQGISKNIKQENGLEMLLGALSRGNHQKYVEQPDHLGSEETIRDGNAILGHILGNKETSRRVAGHAAEKTGLDSAVLKKMLPVVATVAMGFLSKQSSGSGITGGRKQAPSQAMGFLSSLLDADNDGSVVDDLLGFAKKLF